MAGGAELEQEKESFFSIFTWLGIDDVMQCLNNYYRKYMYDNIIEVRRSVTGLFFNIFDPNKPPPNKIAHISFHTGDKGVGGKGQTHFKLDNSKIKKLFPITIRIIGEHRPISSISIESGYNTVNMYLDREINMITNYKLRDLLTDSLFETFNKCAPKKSIRRTPQRTGTRNIPASTKRRRRRTPKTPSSVARKLKFGGGGKKVKTKESMTKEKIKYKGVIRNIRISKTGRKYILLNKKKYFLK